MKRAKKLVVLGLDGLPFSLLNEAFAAGRLPNLKRLSREGVWAQMNSVIPTVSSVAWATFMTGQNPAQHGIYGFVERSGQMKRFIPTGSDINAQTLWDRLNQLGVRTIVMNVPLTYPPKPVNGILISGFLGPNLDRITYPQEVSMLLKKKGYIIDPDPRNVVTDKDGFLSEIFKAFQARADVALHLLREEAWDFFMCHIMETDRLHHFFWDSKDDTGAKYHRGFWKFYKRLDEFIGGLTAELPQDTGLLILSDHGFCAIKVEVDLNVHLHQCGFLTFKASARHLADLDPGSVAYSLPPGRIYLNLKGREQLGWVDPDSADYEKWREEIAASLLDLADPESGDKVIQRVHRREALYKGLHLNWAADLIAHPQRGYDLKADIRADELFSIGPRIGMHTYRDACLFIRGVQIAPQAPISIVDVTPTIFDLMGLPIPGDLDGRSLLPPCESGKRIGGS
ncbi:MAG: alkaline phosphatase family protein [Candidatus Bipolaricaulia bacterium]